MQHEVGHKSQAEGEAIAVAKAKLRGILEESKEYHTKMLNIFDALEEHSRRLKSYAKGVAIMAAIAVAPGVYALARGDPGISVVSLGLPLMFAAYAIHWNEESKRL